MSTPSANSVAESTNAAINGLLEGSKWSSNDLTYSFWNTASGSWSDTEKQSVRDSLTSLAAVANITFTETTPTGTALDNTSDLSFYFSNLDANTLGLGYFPDPNVVTAILGDSGQSRDTYPTAEGDIQFNKTNEGWVNYLAPGGDGYQTILHELGHTLGLKHPHDDGANGKPSFASLGLADYDNYKYTMMSYNPLFSDSLNAGNNATPSVLDIQALQYIYGANTSYHADNSIYTLTDDNQLKAIWDAGGSDTFDASPLTGDTVIDLTAGNYSTLGAKSVVGIAYNVTIENAYGGGGNDRITGNSTANIIIGNNGNDTLISGDGNDAAYGNIGADAVYGNIGDDSVFGGKDSDGVFGGQGNDAVYGNFANDIMYGNFGNDTLFGGKDDDVLYGGRDNDLMLGNTGDDTLFGNAGDDTLTGGSGNDLFVSITNGGNDFITDFTTGDHIQVIGVDTSFLMSHLTDSEGNAIISFSGGTITLIGISSTTIDASVFV